MTSDEPRRLIEVGTFPTASVIFVDGDDPARLLLRDAGARLDREHAEAERKQKTAALDIEQVKRTKRARAMRHLRKALRLCLR
jgi:hypothetical protein